MLRKIDATLDKGRKCLEFMICHRVSRVESSGHRPVDAKWLQRLSARRTCQ